MKLRVKFSKHGSMKFVGHLDIMRYFQKALRRAEIDVALSDGFSPHQKMSFALPLGLGLCSNGEYFDVELNSDVDPIEVKDKLNMQMNDEIEVLSVVCLGDKAAKAMSMVKAADYSVYLKDDYKTKMYNSNISKDKIDSVNDNNDIKENEIITGDKLFSKLCLGIDDFLSLDEIVVLKKTKKSEREVDIKPLIYDMKYDANDNGDYIFMRVSQGSENNLKPEMVIEQMCKYFGYDYDTFAYQYVREELLSSEGESDEYHPLEYFGVSD